MKIQNLSIALLTLVIFLASCASPAEQPPRSLPAVTETSVPTQTPAPTETQPVINSLSPFEAIQKMQRGVNMGNTLEAPREGEWGFTITQEHFQQIRAAGFDSVRIPTRWSAHALTEDPYTIEPTFFARLDEVIGWALEQDLMVVLNIHHYEEMATEPAAHEKRFLSLWQQIAEHYKDYPPTLIFELMNEPNSALTPRLWNDFIQKGVAVIRESNPTRNIILGGTFWNAYDQLRYVNFPPGDGHLIATFHYYLPFEFTHQGAEWAGPEAQTWLGTTWNGTDEEKAEIKKHFTLVAAWAKQNNIPVYLGEFGAYSTADMDSRARWTSYVREQAEARGFAWAYWEFGAGFGVYDRDTRQWRDALLKALIP
ncbi:MAG: glycoside hydrolase family 5 protein [Anaerolineales bacterium]